MEAANTIETMIYIPLLLTAITVLLGIITFFMKRFFNSIDKYQLENSRQHNIIKDELTDQKSNISRIEGQVTSIYKVIETHHNNK